MFTGLIEKIGTIKAQTKKSETCVLTIGVTKMWDDLMLGESVAVNGVCLTVTTINSDSFTVDVSLPTLRDTNMGRIRAGERVNLERAVCLGDRIGGHLVQGHVDGIAITKQIKKTAANVFLTFHIGREFSEQLIVKGSIAVDGVSLTIQELTNTQCTVVVIPHTFRNTTFSKLKINDPVNIEVDMLSKYVKKHVSNSSKKPLSVQDLRDMGY